MIPVVDLREDVESMDDFRNLPNVYLDKGRDSGYVRGLHVRPLFFVERDVYVLPSTGEKVGKVYRLRWFRRQPARQWELHVHSRRVRTNGPGNEARVEFKSKRF